MKKRIFSMLVAICLVLSMIPTVSGSAFASTTYVSDSDVTYEADGGNIYFDASTGTITGCDKRVTSVEIPEKINEVAVTSIGPHAFDSNHLLESIKIPKSIKSIGKYAFYDCSKLNNVEISDGVEKIDEAAFQMCRLLESIEIPESVTELGKSAFEKCEKLTKVVNSSKIESIADRTFYECRKLTTINIPTSVTAIGEKAFYYCNSLVSLELPANLKSIGESAFSACTSLTSLNIPTDITDIGDYAFSSSKLSTVNIPSGVTSIGEGIFSSCSSLTSVEIPDSVTGIAANAFSGCSNLQYIVGKKGSYAEQYANENNIPFVATHTHCVCGAEHKNIGDHTAENVITFTAWTDTLAAAQNGTGKTAANSLPSVAGNYYLTSNVTISSGWQCKSNITICLNGKDVKFGSVNLNARNCNLGERDFTITDCYSEQGKIKFTSGVGVYAGYNGRFFMYGGEIKYALQSSGSSGSAEGVVVTHGAAFNMYGGKITDFLNVGHISYYEGVYVKEDSEFNMYGGEISVGDKCIGVVTSGKFTMSGGEIKNNKSTQSYYKAGGVYVDATGTFIMTGGDIKNNTGPIAGGVYSAGTVTISGNAKIQNNLSNRLSSNLYIPSGKTVTITDITGDAQIGITTEVPPTQDVPVTFSSSRVSNFKNKIISDSSEYMVDTDSSKTHLILKIKPEPVAPTLSNNPTATATYGQKLSDISLTNPSGNTEGTWEWMDGTQSVGDASDTPKIFKAKFIPSDTDTYNTVEDIHISVMVNPKPLTNDMLRMDSETKKYNGSAIEADFTVSDGEIPLVKDEDFNVDYSNNVNAGQATVNVNGIGNYSGTIVKNFKIEAADIKDWEKSVELEYDQVIYDGSAKTPEVTISGLTENVDFIVSYEGNTEEGKAAVIISGIGNYAGEIQTNFEIIKNLLRNVSGTAISWNNTDDAVYLLYAGTTADSVIRTEWKDNSYGTSENVLNKDCTKGDVSANADTKRWNQTFSFSGVSEGTYKLAILKPGHGIWIETITVENNDISGKNITLYMYGDVNGDGKVKGADKMILARYLAKWEGYETLPVYEAVADLNCDGNIKGADKMILARYLAKWTGYETLPINRQ